MPQRVQVTQRPRRRSLWAVYSAAGQPGDSGSFGAAVPAGSPSSMSCGATASVSPHDVQRGALCKLATLRVAAPRSLRAVRTCAASQPGDIGSFGAAIPAGSPSSMSSGATASVSLRDVRRDALPPELEAFSSGVGQNIVGALLIKVYEALIENEEKQEALLWWLLSTVLHQADDLERARR